MEMKNLYWGKTIGSILIILLLMPLGHALMIIMEHTLEPTMLHYSAFAMGFGSSSPSAACSWKGMHSAANPVTRIISTVYGDKTVNLKEQLTWSPASNFSLTGRAGYFFRETVRSADQPERYRDFSGGLRMNSPITDGVTFQIGVSIDIDKFF